MPSTTRVNVVCVRKPAPLVFDEEDDAVALADAEVDEEGTTDEDEEVMLVLDEEDDDDAVEDETVDDEVDIVTASPWICQPLERVPLG